MLIRSIQLRNYRNYDNLALDFAPDINVFLGANAQGKTNIIEAVYYASLGRSHRTHQDQELIRWEQPAASVHLRFARFDVENELEFQFARGKRRRILFNGHPIRTKDLIGSLNTVLFSPEDLYLIKGAPTERRRFLDGEISQASPAYYHELVKYNRIVQQRNNLLKKIRDHEARPAMLDLWDTQLIASGVRIIRKRLEAVQKLNMLANLMQRRISGNQENEESNQGRNVALENQPLPRTRLSFYDSAYLHRTGQYYRGNQTQAQRHFVRNHLNGGTHS